MLLESLALRSADMAGIVGPEDAARLASLDAQVSALSPCDRAGRGARGRGVQAGKRAQRPHARVGGCSDAIFARAIRATRELAEVELIDAERASALARPGEALISYLVAGDEAIAFVVRRGRPLASSRSGRSRDSTAASRPIGRCWSDRSPASVCPFGVGVTAASSRRSRVPTMRRRACGMRKSSDERWRRGSSRRWSPRSPAPERWIISPDAALAALPFEALPRRGRPLVASTTVSYVQSLSVLALMQARPALAASERSLLAMGAPQFADCTDARIDDRARPARLASQARTRTRSESVSRSYEDRGLRWSPLPGAEREIEAVAALFPASDAWWRCVMPRARQRLRSLNASGELAGFRYLLFATHAYLDTVVPARSALVLSQVDLAPGTDGYLTVAKWPAYRLQSELAVLSACETGLGRQVQGEGVMGLPLRAVRGRQSGDGAHAVANRGRRHGDLRNRILPPPPRRCRCERRRSLRPSGAFSPARRERAHRRSGRLSFSMDARRL